MLLLEFPKLPLAGDVVLVTAIVGQKNTATVAGRRGKKASETSTYKLFLKANSVLNHTTDSKSNKRKSCNDIEITTRDNLGIHSRSKTRHSDGNAMSFSRDQLLMISKLAHFDPLVGSDLERQSFPFDMLVKSLCPSIIGHELVKAGLLLALLGGKQNMKSICCMCGCPP